METTLNVSSLKQASRNVAIGSAIFLGAALAAIALSARAATDREAVYPQADVAASIAQQGNRAVRLIEREARDHVQLDEAAPLAELATVSTDVALK